ncbi:Sodium:solute symporter family protein [Rhodovastum atsumiense]|uniref:Sodium:solute symporter family protein n=1 Tax=Rhodovastum atsumiense TaxID=504468 RepID=A0A5M6J1B3_9PROT|nr:sodium:solute symporter family protein [Rhodovastum atsumiense]KAA5613428.1 sodium:solute symporter family protein [Rhodovastum atsumiense]CAH2603158.1 Sodium:solute symporter family protein [Rhodovastum atsumiense]
MSEFGSIDTAIIVAMIIAYILFTSWLTVRLRSRTSAQFMVAGRALPAAVIGILLMSEFVGAKSTVGTAQEAFNSGIASAWSVIGASIGFLLFGLFFVRKLYGSGEYTISAAIAQKYGRSTMLTVSIIMIYALLLVNVGNYISGAAAISTVMKINLPVAMCIIAAVSTFYFVFGGLKGVAYVTLLHTGIKVVGVGLILGVALYATGGIQPMMDQMPAHYFTWDGKIGPATIIAWTFGTVGAIFSTQFIVQAISGSASANDARRSCLYAAALCFPLGVALALIGVAAKYLHPGINSLYALPVFLQGMNPILAGVVAVGLIASVFVSVCTVALAIASLIVRDFYVPRFKPTPEQELRATRWISLVIGVVPLVFVFAVPAILKLSFFTRALRLSISIVALIGFYLPAFRSNRGATLGLIAAAVATTVWYALGNPFGIDNMYVAAVTPILVMGLEWALGWQNKAAIEAVR